MFENSPWCHSEKQKGTGHVPTRGLAEVLQVWLAELNSSSGKQGLQPLSHHLCFCLIVHFKNKASEGSLEATWVGICHLPFLVGSIVLTNELESLV